MTGQDQAKPLTARKLVSWIPYSDEMLSMALSTPLIIGQPYTEEELAEMRREHEAHLNEVQTDYQRTRELCASQPAALAVLDLHRPHDHYGIECDVSEYDELPTDWPCSTYEAVRNAVA